MTRFTEHTDPRALDRHEQVLHKAWELAQRWPRRLDKTLERARHHAQRDATRPLDLWSRHAAWLLLAHGSDAREALEPLHPFVEPAVRAQVAGMGREHASLAALGAVAAVNAHQCVGLEVSAATVDDVRALIAGIRPFDPDESDYHQRAWRDWLFSALAFDVPEVVRRGVDTPEDGALPFTPGATVGDFFHPELQADP